MEKEKNEAIDQQASDLYGWLQSACGDIAHGALQGGMLFLEDDVKAKIRQAEKDGVTDLQGWYADEIYNDASSIRDLLGDRIYDAAKGEVGIMFAIATKLKDYNHTALTTAMENFIADHGII